MSIRSLRSRLILASILWTAGLLMLMHLASVVFVHAFPMPRGRATLIVIAAGLAMMAAGFASARSGLTPFRELQRRLAALRRGEGTRIEGEYPQEVAPLVENLNALLNDREKAIERAHAAAGDLAHGLKTPLALLTREADVAAAAGHRELAAAIRQQLRRMTSQVDYQLARARAAAATPGVTPLCPLEATVAALVRAMDAIHAGRGLEISANVAGGAAVRVRREDLDEILGNLLDNACKWARGRVTLQAIAAGAEVRITVDDDGPGLPPEMRRMVLERGVRLDESAPGSGLGLSIVRDLTTAYGGAIELSEGELGGLSARVTLPGAESR